MDDWGISSWIFFFVGAIIALAWMSQRDKE